MLCHSRIDGGQVGSDSDNTLVKCFVFCLLSVHCYAESLKSYNQQRTVGIDLFHIALNTYMYGVNV